MDIFKEEIIRNWFELQNWSSGPFFPLALKFKLVFEQNFSAVGLLREEVRRGWE